MAVAVISEFNPFHNGHKYLVQTAKKITNEPVIAIMSGSFTQRGEVAVTDKFSRARVALENGVDLVLELPAVYSVANAQRFAFCGVETAKSFDCVNYLAFGCESGNAESLKKALCAIKDPVVNEITASKMSSGDYYPRALQSAVREVFGEETAEILSSPNNILAVEYLKNLADTDIKPLAVRRTGTDHDSEKACSEFASASLVRSIFRRGESAGKYVPSVPQKITFPENLDRIMLYKLRMMSADDFRLLPDVNEGLENRIINAVRNYNSSEEIISAVKTKRYTHARLRRIMTCALLDITENLQCTPIEYVRVLGFTKTGSTLLKDCRLEVVTSVAKALKNDSEISALLKKDVLATDISALAYNNIGGCGNDYTQQIIKI